MRYLSCLFFISLFLISCDDDLPVFDNTLQLDGNNATAPILDPGEYETAAYFSANIMADKADRQLREVEFYLYTPPASLEVIVYGEGSVTRPGSELYSATITSGLREGRWNTHVLPERLTLDGNPIWISVKFNANGSDQIIGCDAGPKENGGDQLFSSNDGGWTTFQAISGESINWNVRGDLVPE